MSNAADDERGTLLLCARVADLPLPGVPTSWQEPCGDCQEPCWVSSAGYRAAKADGKGRYTILCTHCARRWSADGRIGATLPFTPEQLADVPPFMRPAIAELARRLIERLKKH